MSEVTTELSDRETTEPGDAGWRGVLPFLADVAVVLGGAWLVWRAWVVGQRLVEQGVNIFLDLPPLFASWVPHTGRGTIPAIAIALLVVVGGPPLAARLRWVPLLLVTYLTSLAWIVSMTLVDGWQYGVVTKLTNAKNYLAEIDRVDSVPSLLQEFTSRIVLEPGSWAVHVSGHPPGALMVFVWLDRIGLDGGIAASMLCMIVGAATGVGIAATVRALGEESAARRILPFAALMPAVVWIGVSADGMFAGVLACGVALLATGAARGGVTGDLLTFAAGLLLGFMLYLSYGLVLAGLLPLVVLGLTRRLRPVLLSVAGVAVVVGLFTAYGFWWFEGYQLVRIRYYQGIASTRPYSYFVWANLACVVLSIGPAALAGLRRMAWRPRGVPVATGLLTAAALLMITIADLSGMSKAETERIWLPFTMWLVLPCALLPYKQARYWLAAQAVLGLLINHLLFTRW